MAEDELVGNLQMELFARSLEERGVSTGLNLQQLGRCVAEAARVFP
jgi:hypothetical protein